MGRLWRYTSLWIVIFSFFLPLAYADPVPSWLVYSSSNASGVVFPLRDTPIKLINEDLTITIYHTGTFVYISAEAFVNCSLTFENPTDDKKTVILVFPFSWDNHPICSNISRIGIALKKKDYEMRSKVLSRYGISQYGEVYKIDELFEKELPEGWDYLALYNLTLEPKETKTIVIHYNDILGLGLGPHEFKYLLSTVKFWNSTPNISVHVYIDPNIRGMPVPEYIIEIKEIKPKPGKVEVEGNILHIYWHNTMQDIVVKYKLKAGDRWKYPLTPTLTPTAPKTTITPVRTPKPMETVTPTLTKTSRKKEFFEIPGFEVILAITAIAYAILRKKRKII